MKAICPSDFHRNSLVATHTIGHMMYCYTLLVNQRVLNKLSKEHNISGNKWSTTQCSNLTEARSS